MPKGKPDKSRIDYLHFRKRVWERYRVPMTKKEYLQLISQAQRILGKVPFEMPSYDNRYRVLLSYKGIELNVIYDHNQGSIVTALHPYDNEKTEHLFQEKTETSELDAEDRG